MSDPPKRRRPDPALALEVAADEARRDRRVRTAHAKPESTDLTFPARNQIVRLYTRRGRRARTTIYAWTDEP